MPELKQFYGMIGDDIWRTNANEKPLTREILFACAFICCYFMALLIHYQEFRYVDIVTLYYIRFILDFQNI